jgi:hypothetical protein
MSTEREDLLVKCWMSHDARWFNAVATEFGLDAANRVNQTAARDTGKVEGLRARRDLGVGPVNNSADCAAALDTLVGAFGGATLLEYENRLVDGRSLVVTVKRCFAHENVTRAGIADRYDCGIFARVQGWLEGLGCNAAVTPVLKGCLKAQGALCAHRVKLEEPVR